MIMSKHCIYCASCSHRSTQYTNFNEIKKKIKNCNIVVAILAQPNIGKSTLFTRITGKISHIANFPGTTVDIRMGETTYRGRSICFIDLPGVYGLSATTIDENIVREFVANNIADLYLVLLDPLNLEKSLYLALQVLEITHRVIIAITKWDIVHSKGIHIHLDNIRRILGVPIVAVSGITGEGIYHLLDTIIDAVDRHSITRDKPIEINYGVLEPYIERIKLSIIESNSVSESTARWLAIRTLEDNPLTLSRYLKDIDKLYRVVREVKNEIQLKFNRDASEIIAGSRYGFCEKIAKASTIRVEMPIKPSPIDKLFQHPILGFISSILILAATFIIAFIINTGFPLNVLFSLIGLKEVAELLQEYTISGVIAKIFDIASQIIRSYLEHNTLFASLIADGIIAGVGAVISFLPLIFTVILFQAALEDSGIGPRMAIALHSLFTKFGLSGRAIYPLLIAIGCNVPAVLSSRTAIDDTERLEIITTISFIPCQARLLVLLVFIFTLFRNNPTIQMITFLAVYGIGILLYLAMSKLLRTLLFKRRDNPELILEVPPLHKPSIKVMMWNSWDLTKHFLYKAGVIILILSMVIWTLLNFGFSGYVHGDISTSYGAYIGRLIAPLFTSLFKVNEENAWKLGLTLIAGFIAKEGLISTLAVMSGVEEGEAIEVLGLTPPQGFSILLLFMFYIPCAATIAVIYNETRSYKYTMLVAVYLFITSILISLTVYTFISIF